MNHIRNVVVLVLILLAAGCAKPPQESIDAARAALETARTAEAAIYAADSLKAAEDKAAALESELQTQQAATFPSYDLTAQLATELKQLGDTAVQAAAAGKEQARVDAGNAISAAEVAIEEARTALTTAPKGKGSQADLAAMSGDLDAAGNALAEARTELAQDRLVEARTKAETVRESAVKVKDDVLAAIELLKGRK